MSSAGLIVFALAFILLLGGSLYWVLMPLWRGSPPLDPPDPRAVALLTRREAALASLRDLEADFRDGRIGDETYHRLRGGLVERGAAVLAALDGLARARAGELAGLSAELEEEIQAAGGGLAVLPERALELGEPAGGGAALASGPARVAASSCPGCGRALAPDARFCDACGRSVALGASDAMGSGEAAS